MTAAEFVADLKWRGLVAQSTDEGELVGALAAGPVRHYCGFDPTAPSLHVGNLVPLLTLRRFQDQGHPPVALVGGATGLIGDPSGRTNERVLNSTEVVAGWVDRIRGQLSGVIDLTGPAAAAVVSNLDWTQNLGTIEFLRDVGKHFSVNVMLSKESIKTRLNDQGISFTEFSYMLLQANDYLELYRTLDCRLQLGGSDQWGNIVAGLDLIRRVCGADAASAHAMTVPLITKSDGSKFGKTAEGAVWLDPELTSPYAFYQYWLNTDDRDIERFSKIFSLAPRSELEQRFEDHREAPHRRGAQRLLAAELTTLVHGVAETDRVIAAAGALFGSGDLAEIPESTVAAALATAPHASWRLEADSWPSVVDLLVATELAPSRGAARRTVREGGAYVGQIRFTDENAVVGPEHLIHDRWWVVRRGKKAFASVELVR